ncbi:Hsp33 family molecular chaperone HslO [Lentilactobacillus senioris]|uniref:Hsp33 family molecular chaperone HslO n=1 Tax=Lentilactobacillus senioris TaxID=931534 RepID=UPI0006D28E59|nr:Hsp33 family molecular chaperone HslO [Lentilactobacillus senioris]
MKDYLVKSLTKDGMFRAYAVTAKQVVTTAQKSHDTWSAASAALGRTLIGTLLLATSGDKSGNSIAVKINGGGPVGGIATEGNSNGGKLRDTLLTPHTHLPLNDHHKIDVGQAVGRDGFLEVTKLQANGEPFNSSVPLVSGGEIGGDDFTFYLAQSEQIPSAVGVSVFVNDDNSIGAAGGYLIQVMPGGASEEAIATLEQRLKQLPPLSELLLSEQTPEAILNLIFGEDQVDFLTTMPVEFKCNCSKEQFAADLTGLPLDQLETILAEDKQLEVTCNFCHRQYHYDEQELSDIVAEAKAKQD